jgi:hypothetical protein
MKEFLQEMVKEMWGTNGQWHAAYKGGDESFFGVGVPYVFFYTRYTPEKLEELNNASLSPWLHSESDTLDKIDRYLFEKHLCFYGDLVVRLSNLAVLPYNLADLADELNHALKELKKIDGPKHNLDFDELIAKAGKLHNLVGKMRNRIKESEGNEIISLVNRTMIKICQELSPILRSQAGKYEHDPYGYSLVGKPIPALYAILSKIKSLAAESEQRYLWETKMLREKNRISDAITNSIDHLEQALFIMNLKERR